MKKLKSQLLLFWEFLRFGCYTFGGGWSIVSQMHELYVEKKKVISGQELLDITSVGRSMPGLMIGNVAMLFGYRVGGILGGICCVVGMSIPPVLLLIGITFCYDAFRTNFWVSAAMEGIQAAVVPIIACAALKLVKGSVNSVLSVLILLTCFAMYLLLDINVVWLILFGIVCGIVSGEIRARKEAGDHGAA